MIPIVFITDKNFIMQTVVAINSLIGTKHDETIYDIRVIATQCDDKMRNEIGQIDAKNCSISIIEASTDKYVDINQLAHIPVACLLKFEICDLVREYDKLIYLDGDIIVRDDLTKLYAIDMDDYYIAGAPSVEMAYSENNMINAGIMLFNAKRMRDDRMSDLLIEKRRSLGDRGSMDQQTFNIVMKNDMKFLPWTYNFIPEKIIGRNKISISTLNRIYKTSYTSNDDFKTNAVIVHFATGGKPWKYDFIKCGDEWLTWYVKSGYKVSELNRQTKWETRKEIIKNRFKEKGIASTIKLFFSKKSNEGTGWG